jgi:hypothetical protein
MIEGIRKVVLMIFLNNTRIFIFFEINLKKTTIKLLNLFDICRFTLLKKYKCDSIVSNNTCIYFEYILLISLLKNIK